MSEALLIRGARQLLTLQGCPRPRRGDEMRQLSIIEDGALLIQNGLITHVGPTRRLENLAAARQATALDVHGRVVMPGLVDAHLSVTSGPARLEAVETATEQEHGESEEQRQQRYLRQTPVRTLEYHARRLLHLGLRHGTTTFGLRCGFGLDDVVDMKCLRAIAAAARSRLSVHRTFLGSATEGAEEEISKRLDELIDDVMPLLHERCLADGVDLLPFATLLQRRKNIDCAMRMRASGLQLRLQAPVVSDGGPVELACRFGLESLDGVQNMSTGGVEAARRAGLLVSIIPATPNAMLAPGLGRALIDAGLPVTIASGADPAAGRTSSLPLALFHACLASGVTAAEAITAATINPAYALKLGSRIGSLEYGKEADLLILHVGDYREMLFHGGMNLVSTVIKRGEVIETGEDSCLPAR